MKYKSVVNTCNYLREIYIIIIIISYHILQKGPKLPK